MTKKRPPQKNNWEKAQESIDMFWDKGLCPVCGLIPKEVENYVKQQKREILEDLRMEERETQWDDNNSDTWNVEEIGGYNQAVEEFNQKISKILEEYVL